jgi:hypothetical protein
MQACEHRSVSKDGRVVCAKITQGDNTVSTAVCQGCPFAAVNCAHLRFSLQQTASTSLVVRFNGRTEVWDDDPPRLVFCHAACAERVMAIQSPRVCAGCASHAPVPGAVRCGPARSGKVVPFPAREPLAATG